MSERGRREWDRGVSVVEKESLEGNLVRWETALYIRIGCRAMRQGERANSHAWAINSHIQVFFLSIRIRVQDLYLLRGLSTAVGLKGLAHALAIGLKGLAHALAIGFARLADVIN